MHVNINKKIQNKEGFTLIELMIVIAIIGILAAIAIPQFTTYRMRSFNAAATSDIRGLVTAQAGFLANNRVFAVTSTPPPPGAAGVAPPAPAPAVIALIEIGGLLTGPSTAATVIRQFAHGATRSMPIPLSSLVSIVAKVDASALSFTTMAKHAGANNFYAADSDASTIYQASGETSMQGVLLTVEHCPVSTVGANEIDGELPKSTDKKKLSAFTSL